MNNDWKLYIKTLKHGHYEILNNVHEYFQDSNRKFSQIGIVVQNLATLHHSVVYVITKICIKWNQLLITFC